MDSTTIEFYAAPGEDPYQIEVELQPLQDPTTGQATLQITFEYQVIVVTLDECTALNLDIEHLECSLQPRSWDPIVDNLLLERLRDWARSHDPAGQLGS